MYEMGFFCLSLIEHYGSHNCPTVLLGHFDLNKVHPHDCIFIPLDLDLEYTCLQN